MIEIREFQRMDRLQRLAALREVQHHLGHESNCYQRLARVHCAILRHQNGQLGLTLGGEQ